MAKELLQGQIPNLPIVYDIKVEDGQLKIAAGIDFAGLVDLGEKALPEGSLKPIEVSVLEIVKASIKAL